MMRMRAAWLGSMALLFSFFIGAAQAEPVAMVTDLNGTAWIKAGEKQKPLSVLSYIEAGSSIRLDAKSSISITTFKPAAEYAASGPASLELVGGEVRALGGANLVKTALDEQKASAGHQFSAVQRERLAMAAFLMRGPNKDEDRLRLLSPVNVEMLNVHPVFSWSAPKEIKRFSVALFDATEGKMVKEAAVEEPLWKLPGELSLKYEHQYSWKVRTTLASGKEITATAEFSIIDDARSQRILQNKPAANAPFSERVLYVVLLESEGLNTDAAEEWKVLSAERPNEPLIAMHLKNH